MADTPPTVLDFKVHSLKPMMLKHAVILTEDLLANDTIIDEGLRAFVAIVKDPGWQYGYVGASIKTRLLGPVKLERSIPVKGTQRRKGLPAPRQTSPRLLSQIAQLL